jgi:MYXO-CTERM domain-containing protein
VIVWDWSVAGTATSSTTGSISGSGTFTTNGDTPTVGTTYSITSVTGSFTGDVPGTFSITGLENASSFQWSGEGANQLLVKVLPPDVVDLSVDGAPSRSVEIYAISFADFIPAQTLTVIDFSGPCNGICEYSLTSASLTPQSGPDPGPDPVPGPLPLMGAGAAFGWSRKVRRRLAAASPRSSFRL